METAADMRRFRPGAGFMRHAPALPHAKRDGHGLPICGRIAPFPLVARPTRPLPFPKALSVIMNRPFAQALSAALGRCIASNEICLNGRPVGFAYREAPAFEQDSGWRFFAGDESDGYAADSANFTVCTLAAIRSSSPETEALLSTADAAGAWEWNGEAGRFVPVADWQPQE